MHPTALSFVASSALLATRQTTLVRRAISLGLLVLMTTGCSSFGSGKLVKQLQSDNEQLLSELRATKSNVEEQKKQNQSLQARLADAEKLLAVQNQGGPRLSSLSDSGSFAPMPGAAINPLLATPVNSPSSNAGNSGTEQLRWQRRIE